MAFLVCRGLLDFVFVLSLFCSSFHDYEFCCCCLCCPCFFLQIKKCSEENVYMLCKKLSMIGMADADGSDLFAVFISNEKKQACIL